MNIQKRGFLIVFLLVATHVVSFLAVRGQITLTSGLPVGGTEKLFYFSRNPSVNRAEYVFFFPEIVLHLGASLASEQRDVMQTADLPTSHCIVYIFDIDVLHDDVVF